MSTHSEVDAAPRRLTVVCRAVATVVVAVFGVVSLLLPRGASGGQRFGVVDQVLFFTLGLLVAGGVLAFTRARVRADEHGVWVRNVVRERFFPWAVVVDVALPDGAPWAQLHLHDDQSVALLALQANDGDTAADAVVVLRRLLQTAQDTKT